MRQTECAIVLPSFGAGGAERVTLNLANALAAEGVAVDLVAASPQGALRGDVGPSLRVVDLDAPRALSATRPMVRYLRTERPEVVLSSLDAVNVVSLVANRLAGRPARVFVTAHSHMSTALSTSPLLRERLLMRTAIRATYGMAAGAIALTDAMADDLATMSRLPRERITVLPNLVLTTSDAERRAAQPAHSWAEDPTRPLVVGIGRLAVQKGFGTLLQAFASLAADTSARLLILGEGPERASLEQQVAALGLTERVAMPGFVDNPLAILSRARLFALSSVFEGLPTVLIEALAAGCPVVATDCPTGPREILEGGRYGRLVPMGDAAALSTALREALDTPMTPERHAALTARAEDFGAARVVPLYRSLLGV